MFCALFRLLVHGRPGKAEVGLFNLVFLVEPRLSSLSEGFEGFEFPVGQNAVECAKMNQKRAQANSREFFFKFILVLLREWNRLH